MFIKIDPALFDRQNDLIIGVVVAEGISNAVENKEIEAFFASVIEQQRQALSDQSIKNLKGFDLYHQAMDNFGINFTRNQMSVEALLNRVVKSGNLPSVNPVVDLANAVSMQYAVPIGVHDIDSFSDDIEIRYVQENDIFDFDSEDSGSEREFDLGEVVYASGNSIRTRRWIWRQMPMGRVNENSKNFVFPIDGLAENSETVLATRDALAFRLRKHFGCKTRVGLIRKSSPSFKIANLTIEELEIEEAVRVILKGAAAHTDEGEIAEKLRQAAHENRPLRVKFGLDPSAPDVHLGHSVPLRRIRKMQELGHQAIIVMGDFTGMIGDPSGRSKTRVPLTHEQVIANAKTYEAQIFTILDRSKTTVVFNSTWLSEMKFGELIELAAKTTVARILERDDFALRHKTGQPISLHEFFYPLMQGYDSVAVEADIEIGGTDQTFNILMARNIQRDYGQTAQTAIFFPLLVGIDGVEKMSKSLNNYIGINEPPHVMYEKIMKIPDSLIVTYYTLCTDVSPDTIDDVKERLDSGVNPRDIKMELAREIIALYYSVTDALKAEEYFKEAYQKQQAPEDVPMLKYDDSSGASPGLCLAAAIEMKGISKTRSDVRRLMSQGAIRLNGEKIIDIHSVPHIRDGDVIQIGKGKFFRICKDS